MRAFFARQWLVLVLSAGAALALLFPSLFAWTGLADPRVAVALALFLMAWTMPSQSLARAVARPWPALWAVVISYGLVPPSSWLVSRLLPTDYAVGLVVIASMPCTLASAVLWTRRAGGDEALALLVILLTTASSWLFSPLWLRSLTGTAVALDTGAMMRDLLLLVLLPVGLGQCCQAWQPFARLAARRRSLLSAVSQCLIVVILLRALANVGARMQEGTSVVPLSSVLVVVASCLVLHLAALLGGFGSSRVLGLDRGKQAAVAFSCSQKTLPVAMLLFESYFQADYPLAILPLAFYHFSQLIVDTPIAAVLARHATSERESVLPG